ncbi:MAG: right-handed parallel beta-helix repeat-containing protein [Candidatus Thermoplasmatota archaeon]|nr:right-handed parallel beta-helix repeat-containing protein [Candidatus Thermoplasmatota archaeon]
MHNGKRWAAALLLTGVLLTSAAGGLTGVRPSGSAAGQILYVGGTGPHNYSTIQAALDVAVDGDTVFVYGGTYHEQLVAGANVTLAGESAATTVVTGDFTGTVLRLEGKDVALQNLQFTRSGGEARDALVYVSGSVLSAERCLFSAARHGVLMDRGQQARLANCSFSRTAIGMLIDRSTQVTVGNCTFVKNGLGVLAVNSTNLQVRGVTGSLNGVTVMAEGCTGMQVTGCRLFNGNENQASLFVERSDDVVVKNCTIFHSGRGIRFAECNNASVINSAIYDSKIGIEVSDTSRLHIRGSWLYDNDAGVYLYDSRAININFNAIFGNYVANLAAEGVHGSAQQNWWGDTFSALSTVYVKEGPLPVYPWLTEAPQARDGKIKERENNYSLPPPAPPLQRKTILIGDMDSDSDGCPDWWEEQYGYDPNTWENHEVLDPDRDGLSNIEEYITSRWGSHPFKQDLFLEIDVMGEKGRLAQKEIDAMRQRFARHNITLHVDNGELGGGETVDLRNEVTYITLIDIYWDSFLHHDPSNWRKGVFHYVLLSDSLFQEMPGFVFIGWDEADAFSLSLEYYQNEIPPVFRQYVLATVFMHELGHTLGLFHDVYHGIDNESSIIPFIKPLLKGQWTYRNYRSCMNYQYAWQILDYSDGTHGKGDFDDWSHVDLTFFQDSHWG